MKKILMGLLVVVMLTVLGTCNPFQGPDTDGTITLYIGNRSARAVPDPVTVQPTLEYQFTATNGTKMETVTLKRTTTGSMALSPGTWDITVKAYLPGGTVLVGTGSPNPLAVKVVAGQSTTAAFTMVFENTKLETLTVGNYALSPTFDPDTATYTVVGVADMSGVPVTATPQVAGAEISYTYSPAGGSSIPITDGILTSACTIPGAIEIDVKGSSGYTTRYTVTASSVYVAGHYDNGSTAVAYYWIDGVKTDLASGGGDTFARAITVSGGSVYVAGDYDNNGIQQTACYWKDGTKTDLTSGGANANATAITVSGGSVYVAGYYYNGSIFVACYWKDGTRTDLTPGGANANATGITVSGGSVYVSGQYDNNGTDVACYWKDGTRTDLTSVLGNASGITVSGGSVYVSGYYNNGTDVACYWKDDGTITKTDLTSGMGNATAITVSGGSVYVSGYYDNSGTGVACYWKDDGTITTKTDLTSGGYASGIAVSGGSVYVAGQYDNNGSIAAACYWKDGTKTDLTSGGAAWANGIFVE